MSAATSAAIRRVLDEGVFCHVAAPTNAGPHVTPMVFAAVDDRVWVTTSRGSAKARAWRRDPRAAGMVRAGDETVVVAGSATTFDLMDSGTWRRSLASSPTITLATARFTRKNARFFAGYAVDARRVPLAWTPPGRVFVEVAPRRIALVRRSTVAERDGEWAGEVEGLETFRAERTGLSPLRGLPPDVRDGVGEAGDGALAVATHLGPVVLPVTWLVEGSSLYAVLGADVLALAGCGSEAAVALTIGRPSSWRASEMVGAMIRGTGSVAIVAELVSGGRSAARIARAAGGDVDRSALVRVRPRSLVWWRGWASGTVAA